jgi:hypothetical protein
MRRLLVLTIGLIPAIWLAAPAGAAPSQSLHVTPSTVAAGGSVQVSGTCEPNTSGFAISRAFLHDATHDFAGVGAASFSTDAGGSFTVTALVPVSITPGAYDVSVRCGGGILGISVTLTVTGSGGPPTAVPAGTGGLAATTTASTEHRPQLLVGLGVTLLIAAGLGIVRLRRGRTA